MSYYTVRLDVQMNDNKTEYCFLVLANNFEEAIDNCLDQLLKIFDYLPKRLRTLISYQICSVFTSEKLIDYDSPEVHYLTQYHFRNMSVKFTPYEHDVVQVLKLGEHYQVKFLQSIKLPGWEETFPVQAEKGSVNNHKLKSNLCRAITQCRNIALSNDWDWFITLTLDPKKYDRYDLDKFHKDITAFFKSINRVYSSKIRFLLVPEKHENGAWHLHGLIAGLPDPIVSTNEFGYFDILKYREKFGFCSLSKVESDIAVSFYITKHLGKQIYNGSDRLGSHLYYCSRGLNRGEVVSLIRAVDLPDNFTFQYESSDKSYKSSFFEDGSFLKSIGLI